MPPFPGLLAIGPLTTTIGGRRLPNRWRTRRRRLSSRSEPIPELPSFTGYLSPAGLGLLADAQLFQELPQHLVRVEVRLGQLPRRPGVPWVVPTHLRHPMRCFFGGLERQQSLARGIEVP